MGKEQRAPTRCPSVLQVTTIGGLEIYALPILRFSGQSVVVGVGLLAQQFLDILARQRLYHGFVGRYQVAYQLQFTLLQG